MNETKPVRVPDLNAMKRRGEKISMVAVYDATMARLFDRAGIDVLLVGDSLGMVVLGAPDTLQVTMEDIIRHTKAVSRGAKRALVVADMPFLSFGVSTEKTLRNAGRLIQEGGAACVKLEGGAAIAPAIECIVSLGIPVMGHIGLTPQSIHQLGGFRRQGTTESARKKLIADGLAVQDAGATAIIAECVPDDFAQELSSNLDIPVIGIGSGPHCDGQVLVSYDLLGLTEKAPSFAKRYARLDEAVIAAGQAFAAEIKAPTVKKAEK